MQLHGDVVSLMEECAEGFENMRTTKTEVGLDAWRRLNHKFDPRNPLRNIPLLEELLAPTQVGYSEVVASVERLEQEMRVVRQRFGDDVQDLWKSIHMVCIQKICPIILRDHLAAQASSIDAPEKQRLTIERFLQANVHGLGASPGTLMPLPRPKEASKAAKEKTRAASQGSSMASVSGVARVVTRWRTVGRRRLGNRKRHSHHELPIHQNTKAKEKGTKARRGRCRQTNGLMIRATKPLVRSPKRMPRLQVSSSVLSADVRSTVDKTG